MFSGRDRSRAVILHVRKVQSEGMPLLLMLARRRLLGLVLSRQRDHGALKDPPPMAQDRASQSQVRDRLDWSGLVGCVQAYSVST
jgi:hypothetical protein